MEDSAGRESVLSKEAPRSQVIPVEFSRGVRTRIRIADVDEMTRVLTRCSPATTLLNLTRDGSNKNRDR